MSTLNNTVLNSTEQTPVRVKKPTLSAKYFKLMEFGYCLVRSLESNGILSADGVESAFSELKLMSSVDEQTVFYENCVAQSSNTGKLMKKFIALRNKPPSKPRTKKSVDPADKKPRSKKSARVENDSENDLVTQLVSAANAVENIPITDNISAEISTTSNEPKVTESKTLSTKEAKTLADKEAKDAKDAKALAAKELKESKALAAKEAKDAKVLAAKEAKDAKALAAKEAKDAKALAAKELKESKSKSTSTKVKKTNAEEVAVVEEVVVEEVVVEEVVVEEVVVEEVVVEDDEDEDEEEIHTTEFSLNGKNYLIDEQDIIYSIDTHESIGLYDPTTNIITSTLE